MSRAYAGWVFRVVAGWRQEETYRRNIFFLSASRLISTVGAMVAYVALVAVVYDRSGHSGGWVAAALVVMFGVSAAVGPWAGALGDRFDRRLLMIGSDLAAAAAFVGIAFAHSLPLLVVLAGLSAAAEAPFGPASQALLVMLVPEDRRTWATATRSSSASAGMLLGGALGGFAVAAFGGTTSFLVNAASFVISAAFVWRIKGNYRAAPSRDGTDHGVSEGFRLIAANPALRLTLLATSVGLLGTGMVNVAEYPLFVDMGGGSKAYGTAVSGWALGGFIAGRVLRRQGDAYSERRRLLFGCALVAVAIGRLRCRADRRCRCGPLLDRRIRRIDTRHRQHADLPALCARPCPRPHLRSIGNRQHRRDRDRDDRERHRDRHPEPAGVCIACGRVGLLALLIATRVPPRKRDAAGSDGPIPEAPKPTRREWSLATGSQG